MYFKNQEAADRYFANIDKDTGKVKTQGKEEEFERNLPYTVKDSKGEETKVNFPYTIKGPGDTELSAIKDDDKRSKTEKEIRESIRIAPDTGITGGEYVGSDKVRSGHSALDFLDNQLVTLEIQVNIQIKKQNMFLILQKVQLLKKLKEGQELVIRKQEES